jgi:hypothetical protein
MSGVATVADFNMAVSNLPNFCFELFVESNFFMSTFHGSLSFCTGAVAAGFLAITPDDDLTADDLRGRESGLSVGGNISLSSPLSPLYLLPLWSYANLTIIRGRCQVDKIPRLSPPQGIMNKQSRDIHQIIAYFLQQDKI